MIKRLAFVVCLAVVAIFLALRPLDAPASAAAGEDGRSELGSLRHEERVRPPSAPRPALREEAATPVPVHPIASGRLVVYGNGPDPEFVDLTWRGPGGATTCRTALPTWSCSVPAGSHELFEASSSSGPLALVAPVEISEASPSATIELALQECFLVDVRSAVTGARLERVTITSAVATDGGNDPIAVSRSKSPRTTGPGSSAQPSGDRWVITTHSPVVLPGRPPAGSVLVSAPGYEDKELANLLSPGVYQETLEPKPQATLRVMDSLAREGAYRVVCAQPGFAQERVFESVLLPRELSVELHAIDLLRVDLYREAGFGRGPLVLSREFDLRASGPFPFLEIDLREAVFDQSEASLQVTVRGAALDMADSESWFIELRPIEAGADFGVPDKPPHSRLSTWERDLTGGLVHSFAGLGAGEYRVLLGPLGIERHVAVEEGQRASVSFDVDALSKIRVWPIDAAGAALDASKLGALVWRSLDPAAGAVRLRNPAFATNTGGEGTGEGELGLDLLLGYARFAEFVDGAWEIVTASGHEIAVEVACPAVLGAERLRIRALAGPVDETLRFSGL